MKVLVFGSTGGSGRAAVQALLARGHQVTAFSRSGTSDHTSDALTIVRGDATDEASVERAVRGHDAVVVTLGIRENPLRVRLFGARDTADDVRSVGTRHVMNAMRKHGVARLLVQTSYGVGDTRTRLGFLDALFFSLLLKPQIADTEVQNREVAASALDWVLVQPVHLTDADDDRPPFVSLSGDTGSLKVSRRSVGRFLAEAVDDARYTRSSVALSGRA